MTTFEDRVVARQLTIAVIGLGYVGLPLALAFAEAGFTAVGFDVDGTKINGLNTGHSHVDDISDSRLAAVVTSGRFSASTDTARVGEADVVFVCVPTPFDRFKTPDLSFVTAATETVARALKPGMLVILQSTTYPGTTTEILLPRLVATGLTAGVDFHLAFSPERVDPGNLRWTVRNTPKVVGGIDQESSRRAKLVLEAVMDDTGMVVTVSSPAAAEMTKLLENTYRAVNIALVNELAQIADKMNIDIWEVIDAAKTKPFGYQAFYPGIGPGGHCIPVDPYYLSWKAREYDFQSKFIELAADTNLQMAEYVLGRIQRLMNRNGRMLNGARVLTLGAAFKPHVSDVRNSRAIHIMGLLQESGTHLSYADPMVPSLMLGGAELQSVDADTVDVEALDLVVVLVGREWPMKRFADSGVLVFDAAAATQGLNAANVDRL
jgi:UDP-N-acetyl-D-glucosamine dehydrogenase